MKRLASFLEMIKISHSIFALPFAVAAAVLAGGRDAPVLVWVWIILAVVSARTAAMSWNRIVDRRLDARNPRTAGRHIPARKLTVRFAAGATVVAAGVFFLAAGMLNRLALSLSPFVLGWLLAYSYTKRFTVLSHVWLGVALGLAPIGAWIAVRGHILNDWRPPVLLAAVVITWTAGFDIIYSCQDEEFDRAQGLQSIPAWLGLRRALLVARALHVLTVVALALMPLVAPQLGALTLAGAVAAAGLLVYEHSLVRPDDLSRVGVAFFTVNGVVSILLGAVLAADHLT